MFVGYVLLFHGVFARAAAGHLTLRESYQICMAGLAATRLFSAGGAGGIVLTAWALRRPASRAASSPTRRSRFLVVTYLVYTVVADRVRVRAALRRLPRAGPVHDDGDPATLALVVTVLGLSVALVPTDFERRLQSLALRHGRVGRVAQRAATVPATASLGIRDALAHLRSRDPALLGAIVYWGCQIGVLWACFQAFGHLPAVRRAGRSPSSSACSATCCRCRAGSAAWTAG